MNANLTARGKRVEWKRAAFFIEKLPVCMPLLSLCQQLFWTVVNRLSERETLLYICIQDCHPNPFPHADLHFVPGKLRNSSDIACSPLLKDAFFIVFENCSQTWQTVQRGSIKLIGFAEMIKSHIFRLLFSQKLFISKKDSTKTKMSIKVKSNFDMW